jgi:hypothetical protein
LQTYVQFLALTLFMLTAGSVEFVEGRTNLNLGDYLAFASWFFCGVGAWKDEKRSLYG